ncbi:YtcA family lipoprotein [Achromobacter sp. JUb104]|jgi:cation transporter-like permease|uniref:YtcA family lipoprotein n=1 Tax=unclassified Achromobacter TaxID=2626865 RepID=UPI000FB2BEA1|nr:YtcA family lipoprotein [Achromobacter sp. JUb104]MCS3509257.1 cation transporter-like permease [Achromobacter sp. JUb104]
MARLLMHWPAAATGLLAGCSPRSAPYVTVFDSYFPAWILCAVIGMVGASLARVLLVRWGIDEVLPWRVLVYLCLAAALMFLTSLVFFTR